MTTPHTLPAALDVAAIEALIAAATPLPWMQARHIEEPRAIVTEARRMHSLLGLDRDGMAIVDSEADAALIVAAVNTLPALLAALRAERAQHAADVAAAVAWERERIVARIRAHADECNAAAEDADGEGEVEGCDAWCTARDEAVKLADAIATTGGG